MRLGKVRGDDNRRGDVRTAERREAQADLAGVVGSVRVEIERMDDGERFGGQQHTDEQRAP